ncbi:noncanonical pyrimidine nucleotidase, YjjG family [Aquimarina sp. AD10]|uniref:YjjG family noncanonical pyrimidine nucleotidase n=2 Tax=Aquimarina TaxID=290174 RepID=UPI000E4F3EDC|nr:MULTISPECIES: YjjG family noncanonical pyrimidine nucleotidase [Aquimarina]AXT62912.1 noncanonical pyrimidine nucleotidase, YjjG family [Aquimarina sp. AD10]RKM94641.1 noncanonical pyrimidine nucleotidase, YjjG family [Aquimarina sp. AD10]
MMNKNIKHVFFDLDHTLWDFDKNSSLAFEMIFEKFNINLEVDVFLSQYQPVNLKYWKLYREERVSKEELRRGRLIDTFTKLEKKYSLQVIDEISHDYIAFLPLNNYLIEGTLELLEYLRPKYHMHIITNGFKEVQNTKLNNAGIKKYFKTVTNSEEVGVKKPNPLIFEHALKVSGAQVFDSVMIGDNYEADILGAELFGLNTICFNYHKEKLPKDNVEVSKLIHIKNYL